MSGIAEIKHRISSVRDTKKITNAMYLIASTKVRKAKADLERTRPYFTALQHEIARMFHAEEGGESIYFEHAEKRTEKSAPATALVITADKGLAGAYNQNVIKRTLKYAAANPGCRIYAVGEFGRQYFAHHGIDYEKEFLYTAQNPTLHRAREICDILLDAYTAGETDRIDIIYTDFGSAGGEEVYEMRLLPFAAEDFKKADRPAADFIYEPSVPEVLEYAVRSFVAGFVYAALVDAYCCEQNERMVAMLGADKNADEILARLSLAYNRERQAAITREITEITSGARAMRLSRKEGV